MQWRRQWLEQGALVAWVTLDAMDEPARFVRALLQAMRVASGRTAFDALALEYAGQPDRELDLLTGVLSEIASLATPTVLMFDDAERLPETTVRESLTYLLYNAPPNLHVVVGSRTPLTVPTWELAAHGNLATVKTQDLRFELDETIAVLHKRFGDRLALDDCVRLHEATEGWPIGLQLAAASIERAPDLHAALASLSARHGDIERFFIESLFSRLAPPVADFLTRIAILDQIEPELCEAVTGCGAAAANIDHLLSDTPIMIVAEMHDWIRLHPLARDFLLGRFEQLPLPEQHALHRRAAEWYAARGRFHEAGRHALAAGDDALAQTCAERSLWDLVKVGKLAEAREWLERIPKEALARDVELRIAAGWIMALGERPAQALELAERAHPRSRHAAAGTIRGCAHRCVRRVLRGPPRHRRRDACRMAGSAGKRSRTRSIRSRTRTAWPFWRSIRATPTRCGASKRTCRRGCRAGHCCLRSRWDA